MEKAQTEVKSPMEHINTSSWGMNGVEIREHRNIAYLNNTILELTERISELEKKITQDVSKSNDDIMEEYSGSF